MKPCEIQVIEDPERVGVLIDETRQAIIRSLTKNPMSLSQLARKLEKTPATIHFHMKKLERAGFVKLEETRTINNNLVEKYYGLAVPPCIVGLGVNTPLRGPVPPRAYRQMQTKLKPFLRQIMATTYGITVVKKEQRIVRDTEKMINEISSESDAMFGDMFEQLNLALSLQDKSRIQRVARASSMLMLCQLLCKPDRLMVLDKLIRRIIRETPSTRLASPSP